MEAPPPGGGPAAGAAAGGAPAGRTPGEASGKAPGGRAGHRPDRALLAVALAALAAWLWVTVPLALGAETLFFRDVLGNHFALKTFGAQELAEGRIPAFNPTLGMGQPLRGNPSALAFYPGNALYLALPFWSAFNLHYALHWLLALVAMGLLARRIGLGREAALLAGLTYAGCGWFLSTLSFYNVVAVAAWWPLAMAGAVVGGRRGVALGGVACGMALLGGEPLTAALGLVPMLVLAVRHGGFRPGFLRCVGIGALGLLVAAPQVVATARVLGFSFRGTQGVGEKAGLFTLPPLRLLELVFPLPFGWPLDVGSHGWWLGRTAPSLGYFLSLYAGIVALWLALRAVRRRPVLAAVAAAGVTGAVVLGAAPELLRAATFGLFRFPEKLLFWYALALPLLAGHGLEAALHRAPAGAVADGSGGGGPRYRGARAAGFLLLAGALAVAVLRPGWVATAPMPDFLAVQTALWTVYLAVGGVLLVAAAMVLRSPAGPRSGAVVVALQLVALLQLFPLLRTAPAGVLGQEPPWIGTLRAELPGPPWAVLHTGISRPPWEPPPGYDLPREAPTRAVNAQRNALDLYPAPGVAHGLTYPLAPDIEGMSSPLYTFLSVEVTRLDWSGRFAWLRATGVQALVARRPPAVAGPSPAVAVPVPGLRLLDRVERQGIPTGLYAVEDPAPDAWWPERVESAPGPQAALAAVAALDDPVATVVAAAPVEHAPGGTVREVSRQGDRLELRVSSPAGGLLVVRRSFHPLYRVRAAETGGGDGEADDGRLRELTTLPAQLTLLGVVVPPGEHRVVVDVDDGPVVAGAGVSLLTLLAILAVAWRGRRRGGAPAAAAEGRAP